MMPPPGDAVALLRTLVRIDSRNPSLVSGGVAETRISDTLAAILGEWGLDVEKQRVADDRWNVIARVRGSGGGRSLMFNGHLDVVGVEGMTHPPFDAVERDGKIYGRGASDMKGGVAAMCAAAAHARGKLKGDLIVAAVVDEEWESAGTRALVDAGIRADAAIVTEPTQLAMMPAHRGFVWANIRVHGRASHGSRYDIGVDAIRHAGLILAELDRVDRDELPRRTHALLGRASLHAGTISGGLGLSTYPDECLVRLERRTLPGETVDAVRSEIERTIEAARAHHKELRADVEISFSQPPSDVDKSAPIVRALASELGKRGLSAEAKGMSAWTDAALLNQAGIPAICFGPGDMGLAHAAEEYIEVRQVEHATEILVSLAESWCNA